MYCDFLFMRSDEKAFSIQLESLQDKIPLTLPTSLFIYYKEDNTEATPLP